MDGTPGAGGGGGGARVVSGVNDVSSELLSSTCQCRTMGYSACHRMSRNHDLRVIYHHN